MTKKEYKIEIDPRVLELLGPNLYTNIYYVLAELIANAYDANAKNVYIISNNDSITVEDDGNGMSYDVGVKKFLNVAHESRTSENDSFVEGSNKSRRKMGRKGVGKLAALAVSENVEVKTIKDGEKSGFVLSRKIGDDHKLEPIKENNINFKNIEFHGTAIVMKTPQYSLHQTLKAAKNNLVKIFPLVNKDFRIHLQIGKQRQIIDSFEKEIIQSLACLITLGDEFSYLHNLFNSQLAHSKKDELKLHTKNQEHVKKLTIKDKSGEEKEFNLEIKGWIGAYRTSRGKKKDQTDFPDNFVSILANNKLGEFNILPLIGKNSLYEVYVVGQLHIDIFEETTLPDMALSNRQGYKSDDIRYIEATKYIRDALLPSIISLRSKFASLQKDIADSEKNNKAKEQEQKFKEQIDLFKTKASEDAAKEIIKTMGGDAQKIQGVLKSSINKSLPNLGIKRAIDKNKKELLISHSYGNKAACDFIYDLLVYAGIPSDVIIYTSSDNANSRIPNQQHILNYLRDFFVDSYSDKKIYVIYVTSQEMSQSWFALSEVGAGWITQNKHDIYNINGFTPKKPLDIDTPWANLSFKNNVQLTTMDADIIAEKIIATCKYLNYAAQSKENISMEIKRQAVVN